ncbi:MAG: HEAT repeat domain-containing protein [Planctomycetota bacterium]
MKIYFCDVCNESIPLQDLKENKATTIKGKIFCQNCNPLNTLPPTGRGGRRALVAAWVMIVLLAAAVGGAGYKLYDMQANDQQDELAASLALVRASLAGLEERIGQVDSRLTDTASRALSAEQLEPVSREIQDTAQKLVRLGDDLAHLSSIVSGTKAMRDEMSSVALKQQELAGDIQDLRDALRTATEDLAARLEHGLKTIASATPSGSASGGGEGDAASAAGGLDAELTKHAALLQDRDAGKRWSAVDALALSRNAAVVPYLIPLLQDGDPFVQLRVVMALGELGAREAVGKLIPLLRDSDPLVREETLNTLVRLTGMNTLRYEARSSKKDVLERGIKQWEDWWEANKDRYATRS